MSGTGARPKELRGSGKAHDGNREKSKDNTSTDTTGARPKEQRGPGTVYGGNQEISDTGITMPLMEGKPVTRPKKQRGQGNASDGHRKRIRTDLKYLINRVSRKRHMSVRLYDVLDIVGASAEFRKLRQDCAISNEIISTIDLSNQSTRRLCSIYTFGSSSEGSTTPGMNSDTDLLGCDNDLPVIDNISDAEDGHSLLIIRDEHTQPGYVKLQRVYNGQPQTVYERDINPNWEKSDSEGRICVQHVSQLGENKDIDERNGPADTSIKSNIDSVVGFRCSKIPKSTREWIGRKRKFKWPTKRMIDKMANMGCFVVGVGHPTSIERQLEWRLSFSLQERKMMFSMNLVQHKCYILLKMIKKDLIEPVVGKVISSYHLKTCMFHIMENTKANIWNRRNLVQCVLLCLSVLLKWVIKGYCPNYFIKEENMFDRDLHRSQRLNIIRQINFLLSCNYFLFFVITLDQTGVLLKQKSTCNVKFESELKKTLLFQKLILISKVLIFIIGLCAFANQKRSATRFIITVLTHLSQTRLIRDHTEHQTQKAFSYIFPFAHLQLAQSFASVAFNQQNVETKYALLKESSYYLRRGSSCDLTSATLLEATVFYKLEHHERCICVLDQLEPKLKAKPIFMCSCYPKGIDYTDEHARQLSALSVPSIMSRMTTCVRFLRFDTAIIPKALQYEMYRSIGTPPGSRDKYDDRCFDLAVVDAVVYLHFMQYLVHTKLNNTIQKNLAIHKLESVLKPEQHLYHRETGYNLLGYIYGETNQIHKAIECFWNSWQIRPIHNAAKWHLCIVLYKYSIPQVHNH